MNKLTTMGILSVLLIASIGIASAMPWGPGPKECADGECEAPSEEEIEEMKARREEIKEAVLNSDWDTFSSLVEEYNLTRGIESKITEETFSTFSEIAQKQEEIRVIREEMKELHEQLRDQLGLEEKPPGQNGQRFKQGFGRGFGRGQRGRQGMGPNGGQRRGPGPELEEGA